MRTLVEIDGVLAMMPPLPWSDVAGDGSIGSIVAADGEVVAQVQEPNVIRDARNDVRRRRTRFIVDSVNASPELASLRRQIATLSEACRELIEHAEWDGTTDAAAAIERARAALAATEETP